MGRDAFVSGAFETTLVNLIDKVGVTRLPLGKAFDPEAIGQRHAFSQRQGKVFADLDRAVGLFVGLTAAVVRLVTIGAPM